MQEWAGPAVGAHCEPDHRCAVWAGGALLAHAVGLRVSLPLLLRWCAPSARRHAPAALTHNAGEMWVGTSGPPGRCGRPWVNAARPDRTGSGVTLAVLGDVIPPALRLMAVALYLFVISNVGGSVPLLVPLIQSYLSTQVRRNCQAARPPACVMAWCMRPAAYDDHSVPGAVPGQRGPVLLQSVAVPPPRL